MSGVFYFSALLKLKLSKTISHHAAF